jgi:triosephosphate isomerase (TIM)
MENTKQQLKTPLIAINFKTYENSIGKNAILLAKLCELVAKQRQANVAICVDATSIYPITHTTEIPVLSQHVDGEDFGAHTGKILAKSVKEHGAIGTLLNHSEDQYEIQKLILANQKAKQEGLITIICAGTLEKAVEVAKLSPEPDFIAYEPPELIGGDISVTTRPQVIMDVVKAIKAVSSSKILVGAGVKKAEDVKIALKLGCDGVLLASGITKAKDPAQALNDLIDGAQ